MIYNLLLGISLVLAVAFSALIFLTGKGDAMGGASAVRTTFKGKASIEDQIARASLILGVAWMVMMLVVDLAGSRLK